MQKISLVLALLALAAAAPAIPPALDSHAPVKAPTATTPPPADPAVLRQGGDTMADAVVIDAVPFATTGTTVGYTDDYDEVCPYPGSISPDVVYSYAPAMDTSVTVDLLGSAYDTKIYIYDQDLNVVACNDDYHPDYTSRLEGVALAGGLVYSLVIDGYGGDAGNYVLSIEDYTECELDIPAGAVFEGEPPLVADYDDCHNFGCQTIICDGEPSHNFQPLLGDGQGELVFHGVSGWYTYFSANMRDGDSFTLTMGPTGVLEFIFDAEFPTYLLHVAPTDCNQAGVVQSILCGACEPATMTITGEPGSEIWIDVAANTFAPPQYLDPDGDGVAEYDYLMEISGLESGPVVVESMSLSAIRALYD